MNIEKCIDVIEKQLDLWIGENGREFRYLELINIIIGIDELGYIGFDDSGMLVVDIRFGKKRDRCISWRVCRKRNIKECRIYGIY